MIFGLLLQLIGALVIGTSDTEALVWLRTIGPQDRVEDTVHPLNCNELGPDDMRITVIQQGSTILFTGCDDVQVYEQGISGWNHDRGKSNLDGKEISVGDDPVLLVLPNGGKQWLKTVVSMKEEHATTVSAGDRYRLFAPDPGIHIIEAWSPKYGRQSRVVTVFQGVRVNWSFLQ